MLVRVKEGMTGFNGRARVHAGDEFEIPDEVRPGAWMDVLKGPEKKQWWQKPSVKKIPLDTLPAVVADLVKRVEALETPKPKSPGPRRQAPQTD